MKVVVSMEFDIDPDAWDEVFDHRRVSFFESIGMYTVMSMDGPPVQQGAMNIGRVAVDEHHCDDPIECIAPREQTIREVTRVQD